MKHLVEFLINNKSTGLIKSTNDFVDLGLSVLWAKCNLGAEEDTDYGNYYQWGGLKPVTEDDCTWGNLPFNDGAKYGVDIQYFYSVKDKVCPNGILSKEYDIAYQTYKGKVHMPTRENCKELFKNTTNELVKNYNNSNIDGRLFIGKNDNSIFIPFGGNYGGIFSNNHDDACIWTLNLFDEDDKSAYVLYFDTSEMKYSNVHSNRKNGCSVRAVKEK